ncbi:TetR family transcriptional regulator [Idiomarina abyssalis]|uniref:TetR family transcriptional regulator n=1 Tax=Idiomarina abyssalis TaxID=86102 RepID=UPI0006C84B92|nr:TetR family transcriptional regulator [Idiomarina abyssalis]KPD20933.1 multidrug transporter AcrB [Idiomarina abyssalis]SFT82735.1 transcriptional regulator, TetR family [Idiomarina abyssalis]
MVRRTKEDAMETRAKLLDAAEALFSENGVTHTSMMQVAEKAGVTRGAIYHHFENKMDLIESLMGRVKLPIDEMREQIAEGSEFDPLEEIKGRSKEFISRVQEDPQVRSLASILLHKCEYIDEVNPIKLRHVSGRNECICDIEKLFESAIERGELATTVDARIAVIGLFSLADGLIYNWLLAPDYFPLVEYGNQAIDSYINGLTR